VCCDDDADGGYCGGGGGDEILKNCACYKGRAWVKKGSNRGKNEASNKIRTPGQKPWSKKFYHYIMLVHAYQTIET
jgi:hypothetical protein